MAASELEKHNHLKERTRQNLLRLIEAEFALAKTMTDLAQTEAQLGRREQAARLLSKVARAIETVRQHAFDRDLSDGKKVEILRRLSEIEPRVETFRVELEKARG